MKGPVENLGRPEVAGSTPYLQRSATAVARCGFLFLPLPWWCGLLIWWVVLLVEPFRCPEPW